MQKMKTIKKVYGKPVAKTIDAVWLVNKYVDPRDANVKVIDLVSAFVLVAGIIISCFYLV